MRSVETDGNLTYLIGLSGGSVCRFPFKLSLLIFHLAPATLSSCHQPVGLAGFTPPRHRFLPPLEF